MSDSGHDHSHIILLYGGPIHEAVASGDRQRMRDMERQAQAYLDSLDGVREALAELRTALGSA